MNAKLPLITLDKIGRAFVSGDTETRAVHNINLQIQEGEYLSISGPSGCGKSTLLSIIGLLDKPTSGSYRIKEYQVEDFDAYQRAALRNKEIGFIFQAFNLIGDLTVLENVELPLSYSEIPKKERHEIAMEKLRK